MNVKDKFTTHSIFTLILNNLNTKLGDNEIILRTGNDQHDFLNWLRSTPLHPTMWNVASGQWKVGSG